MSYTKIPERSTSDSNASADINQLQENLNILKGGLSTDAPVTDLKTVLDYLQVLAKKDIDTLIVKPNVTNYNTQLDILFSGLRVEDKYLTSISTTIDITTGLDMEIEAISTWYYVWCFVKEDNSYIFKFSTSPTVPTPPVDYSRKRLISAVYNNASSNFVSFNQQNNIYNITRTQITAGTSTSYINLNISTVLPNSITKTIFGDFAVGGNFYIYLCSNAFNLGEVVMYQGNNSSFVLNGNLVYYKVTGGTGYLFITRCELNI